MTLVGLRRGVPGAIEFDAAADGERVLVTVQESGFGSSLGSCSVELSPSQAGVFAMTLLRAMSDANRAAAVRMIRAADRQRADQERCES